MCQLLNPPPLCNGAVTVCLSSCDLSPACTRAVSSYPSLTHPPRWAGSAARPCYLPDRPPNKTITTAIAIMPS